VKGFLRFLLVLLLIALAAGAGYFFLDFDDNRRKPLDLVPPSFVYLIESDQPLRDWQELSESEIWRYLKRNEFFGDISSSADYLDSLIRSNQRIVDLLQLGEMYISAHMTGKERYDFLILADLGAKAKKLTKLRPVLPPIFENLGYQVEAVKYFNVELYRLRDPASGEVLSIAALDNVLISSYTEELVKQAIQQSEQAPIEQEADYRLVRESASRNGAYTLYLNYAQSDAFLRAFTQELPAGLSGLGEALSYSALDLRLRDEYFELDGPLKQQDSAASLFLLFEDLGEGRVQAPAVLPARTALFSSIGIGDFSAFFRRTQEMYAARNPEAARDLEKNLKRLDKLFKIDVERDFFSWMDQEVATALVPAPPGRSSEPFYYYGLLHFRNYEQAQERLAYLSKRVDKSPLKVEELDYKGYTLRYITARDFFQLFFRKLFSEIETPHYALVDDYVVFSNDTASLQYLIDSYLEQQVLARQPEYQEFAENFSSSSNLFTYLRTEYLYGYLNQSLDFENRKSLQKNREYLLSFPQAGFQVSAAGGHFRTYFRGRFSPTEGTLSLINSQ
jgi:hypothetical protein